MEPDSDTLRVSGPLILPNLITIYVYVSLSRSASAMTTTHYDRRFSNSLN